MLLIGDTGKRIQISQLKVVLWQGSCFQVSFGYREGWVRKKVLFGPKKIVNMHIRKNKKLEPSSRHEIRMPKEESLFSIPY